MKKNTKQNIFFLVFLGAAYIVIERTAQKTVSKKIESAKAAVIRQINPVDPENVAYTTVNSALQKATGNSSDTLGSYIYDLFHNQNGSYKFPWQRQKGLFE